MQDKFIGALVGLAVGDAVGTTVEFSAPGSFRPMTDMVGGGPFNLKKGEWTDDTSLALCLAYSLISKGYNPDDQMKRYVRWMLEGYMSSNGRCFDIGLTTRNALNDFIDSGEPYSGETSPHAAGNGSLMRLSPIPMYYANNIDDAIEKAGDSSRTTHGAVTCVDACRFYSALIVFALNGESKEDILNGDWIKDGQSVFADEPLCPEIEDVALGSYKIKNPPEIKGTGYVVQSLEAALWCFYTTSSYKEAILTAANLGDDADTTAAIVGQLAGAYYGVGGIPKDWLDHVVMYDEMVRIANDLFKQSRLVS